MYNRIKAGENQVRDPHETGINNRPFDAAQGQEYSLCSIFRSIRLCRGLKISQDKHVIIRA